MMGIKTVLRKSWVLSLMAPPDAFISFMCTLP